MTLPRRRRPSFRADGDKYNTFYIAETLGMTVHELLTGRKVGISAVEFDEWIAYLNVKAQEQEKAAKKAARSR